MDSIMIQEEQVQLVKVTMEVIQVLLVEELLILVQEEVELEQ